MGRNQSLTEIYVAVATSRFSQIDSRALIDGLLFHGSVASTKKKK